MNRSEVGRLGWLGGIETRAKQKQERLDKYSSNPTLCKNCSEKILYLKRRNTFCSHSCAAIYHNGKRGSKYKDKKCLSCDNSIIGKGKKYCSHTCQWEFNHIKTYAEWIASGIVSGGPVANKKFLRKHQGNVCSICTITEWMNKPAPLVMDHINGHSWDNRIVNLRLVCGNCDMQLPTYKSKNKGNGRHKRRQRYKDGKSY